MKVVLISQGFGAGWSTWMEEGREAEAFALTYPPLIEALLAGEDIGYVARDEAREGSPLARFVDDYFARFGRHPYIGGARDLKVAPVDADLRFRIDEYDGSESISYMRPEAFPFAAPELP